MKVRSLPTGKYTLGGMVVKILPGDRDKNNRMIEIMGHCSIISGVEKVEGGWKITCKLKTRGKKKEGNVRTFEGIIVKYEKGDC